MRDAPCETRKGMNASVKVRHKRQIASAVRVQQRTVGVTPALHVVARTVVNDVVMTAVNVNVNDAVNVTEIEVANADAVTETTAENADAGMPVTYPCSRR